MKYTFIYLRAVICKPLFAFCYVGLINRMYMNRGLFNRPFIITVIHTYIYIHTKWYAYVTVRCKQTHDDVIKWNHFPRKWSFVRRIHRSPVKSPHKGRWRGAFDVFFDLRLNKRLGKQSWGWWFETLSCPLWRHCNAVMGTSRSGRLTVVTVWYRSFMVE